MEVQVERIEMEDQSGTLALGTATWQGVYDGAEPCVVLPPQSATPEVMALFLTH